MTGILLFCVAEEAKPFVYKATHYDWEAPYTKDSPFFLAESRKCPDVREGLKQTLTENDIFENTFLGAPKEECQRWVQDVQYQHNFLEQDFLFIADARSAKDETLLVTVYNRDKGFNFQRYGMLPPEANTWYDFRVKLEDAQHIHTHLYFGEPGMVYPLYYHYVEQFLDEHGVFDVARSNRIASGKEDVDGKAVAFVPPAVVREGDDLEDE